MSFTSVDFPEPETPVTTVITPSGNVTSRFLRLFSLAPRIVIAAPLCWRRSGRISICTLPEMYAPVSESGLAHDFFRRAVGHQPAAVAARAGAKIDHVIGAADGFFVVLHDQHGVAQIAQIFQRRQAAGPLSR